MRRIAMRIVPLLGAVYLAICGYMYAAQDFLIFKPSAVVAPIAEVFPGAKEHWIDTPEGQRLQLWYKPAAANRPTLLYLHGNAGNLSTRKRLIDLLSADNRGLAIFSWGGYGQSSGTPSESTFYSDARAVIAWLETQQLSPETLILYGESLGSGVAVELASRERFSGVILAAPYTSITAMASVQYPWLPVDWLLKHRFDSLAKIGAQQSPLVVMHSRDDPQIPFRQGKQLFDAAAEPKLFLEFSDRGHTGFIAADIEQAIGWIQTNESR